MAISVAAKTSGNRGGTPGTSSSTASITPTLGAVLYLAVEAWDPSLAAVPTFNSITGNGLTWDLAISGATVTSGGVLRFSIYKASVTSVSAGAITITTNISSNVSWCVVEATGVKTTGSNAADSVVQVATNNSSSVTSLTATLSTYASSDNRPLLFVEGEDPNTSCGVSDFTLLNQASNYSSPGYIINLASGWKNAEDTTCVGTQASASFMLVIALELAASVAATGKPYGSYYYPNYLG